MKAGEIVGANRAEESGFMGHLLRITLGICLTAFLASSALAQYGGGGTGMGTGTPGTPGYVPPKNGYGSGKAIGIGVGAAAAGAGVLFLALHHRGGVTGCVQKTDDKRGLSGGHQVPLLNHVCPSTDCLGKITPNIAY